MRQRPNKKTIVFAMKCLGIALLMASEANFDFSPIPIPVDSRVKSWTPSMGEEEIRDFWARALDEIRKKESRVTMIHLDSFLWQLAGYTGREQEVYLMESGIEKNASTAVIQSLTQKF